MKKVLALLLASLMLVTAFGTVAQAADPVNLIWIMGGTEATDHQMVWDKLNEMTARDLGITVTQKIYDGDRATLATTTGEEFDIIFTCEWYNNYAVRAADGYFAELDDMLPTVAPDLYKLIPEGMWEGSKVNGKIYAIPVLKDTAATNYIMVEKKYLDELGFDLTTIDSFEKTGEIAKAIKEKYPDQYPITLWRGGLGSTATSNFDMINRETWLGLPYSSNDNKVVSLYEHPDFVSRLKLIREWNQAGYINPDATTLLEESSVLTSPIRMAQGWPYADVVTWNVQFKTVFTINKIYGPVLSTSSIRGSMNAISANSKHKEEALKYQEYVNCNAEYRNLLRYGIEGVHYTCNEDGTIKEFISDGYQGVWGFAQGTFLGLKAAAPAPADLYEQIVAMNAIAVTNDAMGFSFNIQPVEDQVGECQVIIDKYQYDLNCGTKDVDATLAEMLTALEAAGYRDVIAECQTQLDAFLAGKAK